jgi:hypothetical protein
VAVLSPPLSLPPPPPLGTARPRALDEDERWGFWGGWGGA